jgi:O-antigen/teichoic acid export membrane protein
MSPKLIKDISASSAQVILNQVFGLLIFLLTSRYLDKPVYGEMNWSLAVLTVVTTIMSLRLEQLVVRRVAAGPDASKLVTLFTAHLVFTSFVFYTLLLIASFLFPGFFKTHYLLMVLAISHLLSFLSSPFKQLANGRENFRYLALMSTIANLIRAVWLMTIVIFSYLTIEWVLVVYIISSVVELIICFYIGKYRLQVPYNKQHGLKDYLILIRESLPLAGTVILNASIARIDWILLGLFRTREETANYSFAYKVFELSPFPLLIIAPILLSRFSRLFSNPSYNFLERKKDLGMLIRIEMILATGIPLVLNIVWTPLVNLLTANKYGSVNESTFFILSCCIPFLYMNNLLWSALFAQERIGRIFRVTFITFLIILAGDLALISPLGAKGAALVYLFATLVEYINYMRSSSLSSISESWTSPLSCVLAAFASGFLAFYTSDALLIRLLIALPVFCFLLLATKQLRKSDMGYISRLFKTKS